MKILFRLCIKLAKKNVFFVYQLACTWSIDVKILCITRWLSIQRSEGIAVDPSAAMANDTIYQVYSIYNTLYFGHILIFSLRFIMFCHVYFSLCFFYIVYVIVKTDPTATEHAEEVNSRVRGGDWEDETDARASLNQLLQTPSDLRYWYWYW